jgi:hypothetical protein
MSAKIIMTIVVLGFITTCFGQQSTTWDKWNWIMGEWEGEGNGQPGQGSGSFSFKQDLDKNILTRRSHSEYPATANKPLIIHDDLMIVYPDQQSSPAKAIYFDNEGHIINYTITFPDKSIVLTSDKNSMPVFRLTYVLLDNGMVNTKFEMSKDGENFMTYVEGKSRKIK